MSIDNKHHETKSYGTFHTVSQRLELAHERANRNLVMAVDARSSLDTEAEALIRKFCSGDRDALTAIFDRYHRLVLLTALRILGDMGEAEDLTQLVFFEIHRKAAQFDPSKGTFKTWLLQYAYHRSMNRWNYLKLRHFYDQPNSQSGEEDDLFDRRVSPPTQEAAHLVNEALATLNQSQRQVIGMVFFEGLTFRDIAERTGQTFTNVRHHYYRGLQRLRECLSTGRSEKATILTVGELDPTAAMKLIVDDKPICSPVYSFNSARRKVDSCPPTISAAGSSRPATEPLLQGVPKSNPTGSR
jgi:RNA polymerase sigma-70 factor, ECF subfamily